MPYKIVHDKKNNCYRVITIATKKIHSKCATKEKAIAQLNILNRILPKEKKTRRIAKKPK